MFYRSVKLFFFISIFFTIKLYSQDLSQKITLINEDTNEFSLNKEMYILSRNDSSIRLSSIRKAEDFSAQKKEIPNFGFTKDVYWSKIILRNDSNIHDWYLIIPYPLIDKIEFYDLGVNGKWRKTTVGQKVPFHKRPISERSFVFPIQLDKFKIYTFYFKFQNEGPMQFPMYISSRETFYQKQAKENFAIGLYYGILGVLLIYNLILLFILKDLGYLYYILFVISSAVAESVLNGVASKHLWPDSPDWASRSLPIMGGLTLFWGLQFSRSFLSTGKIIPILDRVILFLMFSVLILVFSPFVLTYPVLLYLLTTFVVIFFIAILFASGVCLDKGYKPAWYFLLSWGIFILGIGFYAFRGFGVESFQEFHEYGLLIGTILVMCLLSVGLAYKLKLKELNRLYPEEV